MERPRQSLAGWAQRVRLVRLGCPPEWHLTRAVSDTGHRETLARHLAGCARCAATFAALQEIAAVAPALSPLEPLSASARRNIGARLWEGSIAPGDGAPFHAGRPGHIGLGEGEAGLGDGRGDRAGVRAGVRAGRWWLPGGWPGRAALAVALVVLVAVGLGFLRLGRSPGPEVVAELDPATSVGPRVPALSPPAPAPPPSISSSTPSPAPPELTPPGRTSHVEASRASIRVTGGARFVRSEAPPDEIVRLSEGTVELEVAPLGPHERFRVITGDAEVEVKGTRFRVTAADNRLIGVYVWHGRVEVRSRAGADATLQAGDAWVPTAPPVAGPAAVPAGSSSAPAARPWTSTGLAGSERAASPSPERATLPPTREALALADAPSDAASGTRVRAAGAGAASGTGASFERAWRLLRAGHAAAAADAFAEVEGHAGGEAIAEDAAYWSAVARGRAGDARAAINAFGDFLVRFPSSAHVGAAETALGWLLVESGKPDQARRHFEAGARDPSLRVRASAETGLDRTRRPVGAPP